jgi:hypothetical protein
MREPFAEKNNNLSDFSRPPLWPSGQSSGMQIQASGFDSRSYQIFWEVQGLERSPLILVSTIEELLERKRSGSGLESREYCRRDPSRWPRGTLYPQKLTLTSPTSGGRSVGIVLSRTQVTEFSQISVNSYRFLTSEDPSLWLNASTTRPFSQKWDILAQSL